MTLWKKKEGYIVKQCKNAKSQCMSKRQPFRAQGKWRVTDVQDALAVYIRSNRSIGKAAHVGMLSVRIECKKLFLSLSSVRERGER